MAKRKRERWRELCDKVAEDDGLPNRTAGPWTEDKLFFWNRYIEITTTAMVGKRSWPGGVVYVDLFGGPGICEIEGKRVPGSAVLAAFAPKPFERILVCEKDKDTAQVCQQRLDAFGANQNAIVFCGDCNELIDDLVKEIPPRSLTLAFVDPEGLHVHFETLRTLTTARRVDLLVLFADRMDILRNVDHVYFPRKSENLDRFLGMDCDWRSEWQCLPNRDAAHCCKFFSDLYKRQLQQHLAYSVFSDEVMHNATTALYRVIFASKHPRAKDFWDKIAKIDRGGQKFLF